MRLVNSIFYGYDLIAGKALDAILKREDISRRLKKEAELFSGDLGIVKNEVEHYSYLVGKIHERVSTLVGHLSIMIAVSIFVLSVVTTPVGRWLITFEVLAYIALTIFTIRALKTIGIQKDYEGEEDYLSDLKDEVDLKFQIQHASLGLTILFTFLLFVFTLIALVLEPAVQSV